MPTILRNPFRKQDENLRPTAVTNGGQPKIAGTPNSKPIDIAQEQEQPPEYKLSEINDSGVFVPPSPPERKSFWSTASSRSTTSTNFRSHLSGATTSDDQFSISRESFDSYRRSFDISARSPVLQPYENGTGRPRASLDSRTFLPPAPRSSNSFTRPTPVPVQTKEEQQIDFEDVDIQDKPTAQQPKKRGLFSRITEFGDSSSDRPTSADGNKGSSWHHFGGRKRGQSGQGSELGAIPQRQTTPKPESQLKKEAHHAKHHSVDKPATTPSKDSPKVEKPKDAKTAELQATAGAAKEEGARADSGIEVDEAAEEMKEVSLDDTPVQKTKAPEVSSDAAPTAPQQEGLKALKSQNSQAPEIKVDS